MTKKENELIKHIAQVAYNEIMELAATHPSLMRQEAEELAKYVSLKIESIALNEHTSVPNRKKVQKAKNK